MQRIDHPLPWGCPGTERRLSVFRFGHGPCKAYIQASLHADELPGMRGGGWNSSVVCVSWKPRGV